MENQKNNREVRKKKNEKEEQINTERKIGTNETVGGRKKIDE